MPSWGPDLVNKLILFYSILFYRCYVNGITVEPSNTNKYITGTLNKGQPLSRGKGRSRDSI